ncbi:MAG: hypothetical protein OXF02_05965 [Simkaniaceae bacterium]|nr:hypothetical protein [Simkaniaceae bacterium]
MAFNNEALSHRSLYDQSSPEVLEMQQLPPPLQSQAERITVISTRMGGGNEHALSSPDDHAPALPQTSPHIAVKDKAVSHRNLCDQPSPHLQEMKEISPPLQSETERITVISTRMGGGSEHALSSPDDHTPVLPQTSPHVAVHPESHEDCDRNQVSRCNGRVGRSLRKMVIAGVVTTGAVFGLIGYAGLSALQAGMQSATVAHNGYCHNLLSGCRVGNFENCAEAGYAIQDRGPCLVNPEEFAYSGSMLWVLGNTTAALCAALACWYGRTGDNERGGNGR